MIKLSLEQKQQIIKYYNVPHSLNETSKFFNLKSTNVIKRVLREFNAQLHTKEEAFKHRTETTRQNNLNRYGVINTTKLNTTKEKIKATKLAKYGDENYVNVEKAHKTCLKKYGAENPFQVEQFKIKSQDTCLKKYGSKSYIQSDLAKTKREEVEVKKIQTCNDRYGVEYYTQSDDCKTKLNDRLTASKKTCLQKYGVESPLQNKDILLKKDKTMIERYGTTKFNNNKKIRNTCLQKYGVDWASKLPTVINKGFDTKVLNGTANSSAPEEQYYNYLIKKYGQNDIIRQYKEDRYPFHCDFYIKSLDTFIELNLSWTHGGKLFTNTKDDILKLQSWEKKADHSDFYKTAIKVWTEKDVLKFNTAKKNNLNYIVYYKEEELYQ